METSVTRVTGPRYRCRPRIAVSLIGGRA